MSPASRHRPHCICSTTIFLTLQTFNQPHCITASHTLPPGTQHTASPLVLDEVLFAHCSHKLSDSLFHINDSLDTNNNVYCYNVPASGSLMLFLVISFPKRTLFLIFVHTRISTFPVTNDRIIYVWI